jgi:hypothetical protein
LESFLDDDNDGDEDQPHQHTVAKQKVQLPCDTPRSSTCEAILESRSGGSHIRRLGTRPAHRLTLSTSPTRRAGTGGGHARGHASASSCSSDRRVGNQSANTDTMDELQRRLAHDGRNAHMSSAAAVATMPTLDGIEQVDPSNWASWRCRHVFLSESDSSSDTHSNS